MFPDTSTKRHNTFKSGDSDKKWKVLKENDLKQAL